MNRAILYIFLCIGVALGVFFECWKQTINNKASDDIEQYLNEQLFIMLNCVLNITQILKKGEYLAEIKGLQEKVVRGEQYPYFDALCEIYDILETDSNENISIYKQKFNESRENFNRAIKLYGTKVSLFPVAVRVKQNCDEE